MLPIITEITNVKNFQLLLDQNPGIIIIKLSATWCGPCKRIEQQVYQWFDRFGNNMQPVIIDVDVSFELYSFLKNKKMVNGIPALLCYRKGNLSYIPDDIAIGADVVGINNFFNRCIKI
jgi:thiol-disulfide isomerase/thioredoxin